MAKDKQLGPGVIYYNLAGDAPVVTIAGVTFADGETVDLVDELGEARARPVLEKLSGNHFFDVEGSVADHDSVRGQVAAESGRERRKPAARKAAVKKSVAKKIEQEDAEHEDPATDEPETETEGDELPPEVETPDAPTLENANSRPRLPRARRS